MKKALIAMSGGVDSSVAAFLIKQQGLDATGVTMKLYDNEDIGIARENTCCSDDDIADARAVCARLSIPYYVFNFRDDFNTEVIDRFIKAYENGSTPNPCIDCNRYIKFERLMRRMAELNMDYVVTGHYALTEFADGRWKLKKALELFPLGSLNKDEVRKIAEENGFVNAKKHDSQDICFVPDGKYAEFIEGYTGKKYECGDFVDRDGKRLGEHKGIIRYTIGQRKGLGLALPAPMYVLEKDLNNNKVVLGFNDDLFTKELYAEDINFISIKEINEPIRVSAKVRYNQKEQPATVERDGDRLHIVFDEPQRAICKGQAVVLYDGDIVVGGGKIM